MFKKKDVLIAVLAMIFSGGAACIGSGLTGGSSFTFGAKFICQFIFLTQMLLTCLMAIMLFRKAKEA